MATKTKASAASEAVEDISYILWPGGNADAEWDSGTIEEVARALTSRGFGPPGSKYSVFSRSTKRNSKRRHSRRGR